jgi:DNA repair exonuclease SbcCD ATPase subunit
MKNSTTDLRSPAAEIANRKRILAELEQRIADSAANSIARPELEVRAAAERLALKEWTCPSDGQRGERCSVCGKKVGFTGYTKKYGDGRRRRHYTVRFIALAARAAQGW